jgi:hypothetical protein
MKKGKWTDGQSVTALPKTKILKIKTRKTPKEKPAEGATPGEAPAAAAKDTKAKA